MLFPVEAGLRPHWRGDSSPNFPYLCSQGEVWRFSLWVPINAPATCTFQCEVVSERDRIRNDPDESCPSLSRLTSGETASPSHLPWSPRQGPHWGRRDGWWSEPRVGLLALCVHTRRADRLGAARPATALLSPHLASGSRWLSRLPPPSFIPSPLPPSGAVWAASKAAAALRLQ